MQKLRIHQIAGYEPLRIRPTVKRAILSACLSVPVSAVAIAVADRTDVSDALRYVLSPGTMLALRFVKIEASHRGPGVFLDAVHAYAKVMDVAFVINMVIYGLLIFGIMTTKSAVTSKSQPS